MTPFFTPAPISERPHEGEEKDDTTTVEGVQAKVNDELRGAGIDWDSLEAQADPSHPTLVVTESELETARPLTTQEQSRFIEEGSTFVHWYDPTSHKVMHVTAHIANNTMLLRNDAKDIGRVELHDLETATSASGKKFYCNRLAFHPTVHQPNAHKDELTWETIRRQAKERKESLEGAEKRLRAVLPSWLQRLKNRLKGKFGRLNS